MNWEAIGAIGEVVGAAGVIATLLYLTSQIRQSTRSERSTNRQRILENFYGNAWDTARDSELRAATLAGLNKYSELPPESKAAFDLLQLRYAGNLHNALLLRDDGSLDDESFDLIANGFISGILTPGGRDWWAIASKGSEMPPSVISFVQDRLTNEESLPAAWTEIHKDWEKV